MANKIYKRTDSARSIKHQDEWLDKVFPDWRGAPIFYDDEIGMLTRLTKRGEQDVVYTGSLALFRDTEAEMSDFLKGAKARGLKLVCAEESVTWTGETRINVMIDKWREARKAGAAIRGARLSADTRKAETAAALKIIHHELISTDIPSKVLLARVGIRSIRTIKNHYGKCREDLQAEYQAEQKRKARREAYREARAN